MRVKVVDQQECDRSNAILAICTTLELRSDQSRIGKHCAACLIFDPMLWDICLQKQRL